MRGSDVKDVVVCGWGPTLDDWDWKYDADYCAVSGVIYHMQRRPLHWVAMDKPEYYHEHTDNPYIIKHVNIGHRCWDERPNVWPWVVGNWPTPNLKPTDHGPSRLDWGLYGVPSSMLAAVQILSQYGYRRMIFAGCDFLLGYGDMIVHNLEVWKPHFEDAGIEWFVSDERSRMSSFCPVLEGVTVG
jgi:hypothetical protein